MSSSSWLAYSAGVLTAKGSGLADQIAQLDGKSAEDEVGPRTDERLGVGQKAKHAALVDVLGCVDVLRLIDLALSGEQLRGRVAGEVDTQAQIVQRRVGAGGLGVLPGEQRGTVEPEHHLGRQVVGPPGSIVSGGHRERSFR